MDSRCFTTPVYCTCPENVAREADPCKHRVALHEALRLLHATRECWRDVDVDVDLVKWVERYGDEPWKLE